jgi:hypothetical protein
VENVQLLLRFMTPLHLLNLKRSTSALISRKLAIVV